MKNVLRVSGIIVLAAVIVFSMTACPPGPEPIPPEPEHVHQWGAWTQTTAATCETAGEETRVCALDSSHKETRTGAAALGHDWNEWGTPTAATITEDGSRTRTCKRNNSHTETDVFEYATGTAGLAYEAIGSTAYRVRKGTVTTGAVHIPAYYRPNANSQYLPVTEIGASDDSISNAAFYNTGITTVTFAENSQLKTIGYGAFRNCTGLTSVTIPSGVTSIGNSAFSICENLTSVTIPAGVTSIGSRVFSRCESLTSITIPEGATSIGDGAFEICTSLTSITIPEGVTSIGYGAFEACESLTSITIPSSVTSIGNYAFQSCRSLTSITISAGVTSIGYGAFGFCNSLTGITVAAGNANYSSEGGILYDKAKTTLIQAPRTISGAVTIPSSVTSIGGEAFSGCSNLTGVTIPASVTSVGSYTFASCRGLTSITIPASVTTVGYMAFNGWGLSGSTQTINIEGHASRAAADAAWGADWRNTCYATINYNG